MGTNRPESRRASRPQADGSITCHVKPWAAAVVTLAPMVGVTDCLGGPSRLDPAQATRRTPPEGTPTSFDLDPLDKYAADAFTQRRCHEARWAARRQKSRQIELSRMCRRAEIVKLQKECLKITLESIYALISGRRDQIRPNSAKCWTVIGQICKNPG